MAMRRTAEEWLQLAIEAETEGLLLKAKAYEAAAAEAESSPDGNTKAQARGALRRCILAKTCPVRSGATSAAMKGFTRFPATGACGA